MHPKVCDQATFRVNALRRLAQYVSDCPLVFRRRSRSNTLEPARPQLLPRFLWRRTPNTSTVFSAASDPVASNRARFAIPA